eukprot:gene2335-2883_t
MSTLAEEFLNDFSEGINDLDELNTKPISSTTTTTTSTSSSTTSSKHKQTGSNKKHKKNDDNNVVKEEEEEEGEEEEGDEDEEGDVNFKQQEDEDAEQVGDIDDLMLSDETIDKTQKELILKSKNARIESIAKLSKSERLTNLLSRVEQQLKEVLPSKENKSAQGTRELELIVECNAIVHDIQYEIYLIHKFVKEIYSNKFPELESSVQNPLDYISVVKRIGKESDLTNVQLTDLLPKSTIMVLLVTMSSTSGRQLSDDEMNRVYDACDMALSLDENKRLVLSYLESRMTFIAPNLSVLLGSSIASKLIGIAGNIQKLAVIPAGNLQTLGADKKSLAGFSGVSYRKFQSGLISQCDIIKKAPPHLQIKALRVLTGKVSIAARVDSVQETSLYGETGRQYRDEMLAKIEKWQEPPPPKKDKPLPAPVDRPKKKRGGAKARRLKERFRTTDLRKAQNRMAFNVEEKTIGDTGVGLGMIGGESGKIRLMAQDRGILKKKKQAEQKTYGGNLTSVSGLQTVVVTPNQGFKLQTAQTERDFMPNNKKEKYFGSDSLKRKHDQT